ncbi:MAG: TRAP transporter large permease [Acidobacteriia bacterium]|nr:TRAP transporter large permease [Terriglobia bacterium]MYG01964.1 TRAP transporter large permease [Terriglobia bacterium]MYK08614.1 TRAP transporter large permease [Terriglobia bacterium]
MRTRHAVLRNQASHPVSQGVSSLILLLLISLLALIGIGVPVAYALGVSVLLYVTLSDTQLLLMLPLRLLAGFDSYALMSLPLFILMGQVMNSAQITSRLIDFSMLLAGRFKSGLGLVNVLASMLFGGISGSSASDTASIGSVLIPEMERRGYRKEVAAGITVASSTMGMVIPPSIPMVLYAVVAQQSVGKLFLGGVFPGIIVGLFQMALVRMLAHGGSERQRVTLATALRLTARSVPVLLMPVIVVGAVVFGIATATESAALGVLYAVLAGFALTRALTPGSFWQCLRSTALTSSKIMIVIALSQAYIWILALERVPEAIAAFVVDLGLGATGTLLLVNLIVLAAGTVIDVSPAILLLTPVFAPALESLGVSPILFGVLLVSGLAVGACTPPVGTCLNVCAAIAELDIGKIFRGAAPFLGANAATLVVVTLLPEIALWLPERLIP